MPLWTRKGWRILWVLAVLRQEERRKRLPGDRTTAPGQFVVGCGLLELEVFLCFGFPVWKGELIAVTASSGPRDDRVSE